MKKLLNKLRNKFNGNIDINYLKLNGLQLGENVYIGPKVIIDYSHSWLISIGDDSTIAPRVIILAHDASTKIHLNYTKVGRVDIGKQTFIGAGSIILPGVNIGNNVIVGAGSIVTKDIPDNCIVMGNPARIIGETDEYIYKQTENLSTYPIFDESYTISYGISKEKKNEMRESLLNTNGFVR